ncbi:helix-turn-helix transcriptional regulator [Saccharopolyspora sp. 6V]|uniref:helix-turn-helix domain-containing protein n=1 Tax=Saccharopolyspora sp. 6V TaxID=2877239 RepID=UPI001CD643A3|nr:helix-turn-helix transcriptional regulator [Saccharopolyspora sp. 6V]MCA1193674.1 helix-turn-helix transcriptional regulator [Saccharopolyspora sp. 6V]
MASSADTPRARALGVELWQARRATGMTSRDLAELVGRSNSHVSRWENGKLTPSEADTATILAVLGVTGTERDRILELARDALEPNWVAPGTDKQLAALTEYERTSTQIINVEPLMIPGLLQTYDYARHIIAEFGASSRSEAEQRAQQRIGRQHVLTGQHPKRLHAIIGEAGLRYPACPPDLMREQLHELTRAGQRDNVEIQVLPLDRPCGPALSGSWALIEFAQAKPVVQLEHFDTSTTITDVKAVKTYRAAVETLRKTALSPADSADLIAALS